MKKLSLICFLVIGVAFAGMAQAPKADQKAKDLQKQIKLTDKQTTQIAAIYKESSAKFEKIKVAEHGNNEKILVAIKPLRAETIKKIKAVLTPAQTIQYDKMLTGKTSSGGIGWGDGWSAPAE
jgi:protein CpxP